MAPRSPKRSPRAHQASDFYLTIATGGPSGRRLHRDHRTHDLQPGGRVSPGNDLGVSGCPRIEAHLKERTLAEWLKDCFLPAVVFLFTAILATNQAGLADSILGVLGVMVAAGLGFLRA